MEAKELRVGNYVDLYGKTTTIQSADFCGIGIAVYQGKAIPLTEKWLLKFGFEKISHIADGEIFVKNSIIINSQFGVLYQTAYLGIYKYVHQLQNLYFALTQKELKI